MKNGTAIGWMVGIVVLIVLLQIVPKPECNDGSQSSSIGRPGACSHHGGVNSHGFLRLLAIIASIMSGVVTTKWIKEGNLIHNYRRKLESDKEKEIASRTPYGSVAQYEEHLRNIGVSEEQIKHELQKYT